MIPEGTRYHLPPEAKLRRELAERMQGLFYTWGYEPVELPALEIYDPGHALAERSFKLVDKTGDVLALRSDFTTALAQMLQSFPLAHSPARLQYAGLVWLREADAELGRVREYTQFGPELIGVSSPEADAEILEMAAEALGVLGFEGAKIEIGLPSLVRDLLEGTGLPQDSQEALRQSIHRKNIPELAQLLTDLAVAAPLRQGLLALPDLYGGHEVLQEARQLNLSDKANTDLEWLEAVLQQLPPSVQPLLDLGRARRLDYYTGINFQAYSQDFGLPLLGGGRYDGTLLPKACGFTVGLERVMEALRLPSEAPPPHCLALDRQLARQLRHAGQRVELAWSNNLEELRSYARQRGIGWLAVNGELQRVE